jgi:hypothetical protein
MTWTEFLGWTALIVVGAFAWQLTVITACLAVKGWMDRRTTQ